MRLGRRDATRSAPLIQCGNACSGGGPREDPAHIHDKVRPAARLSSEYGSPSGPVGAATPWRLDADPLDEVQGWWSSGIHEPRQGPDEYGNPLSMLAVDNNLNAPIQTCLESTEASVHSEDSSHLAKDKEGGDGTILPPPEPGLGHRLMTSYAQRRWIRRLPRFVRERIVPAIIHAFDQRFALPCKEYQFKTEVSLTVQSRLMHARLWS